ncbi:MAG: type II toxin-antitoxin system VapC family toxin [Terriglobales bacterium]
MILLDTSVLVTAMCGDAPIRAQLRALIESREVLALSALVLYEYLRGPRSDAELAALWDVFPPEAVLPFVAQDAVVAAGLYRQLPRARSRAADIAIAA